MSDKPLARPTAISKEPPHLGPSGRRDARDLEVLIEPSSGWPAPDVRGLWASLDLLYILVKRDLQVRYQQMLLGPAWIILNPVLTMVVYTLLFGRIAGLPSDGVPYPVFSYAAILPWTLFATTSMRATQSLVDSLSVISKVYFPRVILPVAAVLSGLVDFGISFLVLIVLLVAYGFSPGAGILVLPGFMLLVLCTSLAIGLWLAPLQVRYRDVRNVLDYVLKLWMIASPVVYALSLVPPKWQTLYMLNPMSVVIEGFRWALLEGQPPALGPALGVVLLVLLLLFGGAVVFERKVRTVVDYL